MYTLHTTGKCLIRADELDVVAYDACNNVFHFFRNGSRQTSVKLGGSLATSATKLEVIVECLLRS